MIISHGHKLIFFATPKTGTTSLEVALSELGEKFTPPSHGRNWWSHKHITPAILKAVLPPKMWEGYFKFVFVRLPADWFISQFYYQTKPKRHTHLRVWKKTLGDPLGYLRFLREEKLEVARRREWRKVEKLDAQWVQKQFNRLHMFKVRPLDDSFYQHPYILDTAGRQLVDHVGPFEHIAEDVALIGGRIGVHLELPHLNASYRRSWHESFAEDGLELHTRLYDKDYEMPGYDRPSASDLML